MKVEVKDLTKLFGSNKVLNSVSASFEAGLIHGLIGRNGSGKTMLLKCICGLVYPSSGTVFVDGKCIGKEIDFPANTGAVIESPGILLQYSAIKNMSLLSTLSGRPDIHHIHDLLTTVGLDPKNKKAVGKYSMGMKQRLGLAMALLHSPSLLLLDEPMTSLDVSGVEQMRDIFLKLKEKGTTLIIATHVQEDIENLCDVVYTMQNGSIVEIEKKHEVACFI